MQSHYLLVVVVSDIKVMSSTVAVIIFAIIRAVNNYNTQTKRRFLNSTEPNQTLIPNRIRVFSKTEPK